MTHYADLTPCDYFRSLPTGPLLAVGWLEPGFEYPQGDPGEETFSRLKELLETSWQPVLYAGGQECGFCRYDRYFSTGNVFIPGRGVTYVAPEGIVHYIAVHQYGPPAEFCAAVKNCPDMGTRAYFEALHTNGWPPAFARPDEQAAAWEAKDRQRRVLLGAGNALVARVEAYRELEGRWPTTLADTQALTRRDEAWHYEVTDQGYRLELILVEEGIKLIWNPKARLWYH